MGHPETLLLNGRQFTNDELEHIKRITQLYPNLSQRELAETICEHLEWVTPTGRNRWTSCLGLLEKMAAEGVIVLPPKQDHRSSKEVAPVLTNQTESPMEIKETLAELGAITLYPVQGSSKETKLWNEYVERYHPLGYKRPFGAHQRYFIVRERDGEYLGCMLFAAAAWALAVRDEWVGWTAADRSQRLNGIVNNTRFLIFPHVRVRYLASKCLSMVAKRIGSDWEARYGYAPVLLETFVEAQTYQGTCYKAANWHFLGETVGRGRMDRYKQYLSTPKLIFVYPLVADFRAYLCGERPYLMIRQGVDDHV